VKGDDVYEH
jgi:U3 small nucleolar RNA-associated protein 3